MKKHEFAISILQEQIRKLDRLATTEAYAKECVANAVLLHRAISCLQAAEPCQPLCEICTKRGYNSCANAAKTTPLPPTPSTPEKQ